MNHPPKILVIDDTPHNIKVADAVLAPEGYQVIGAGSGTEGVERAGREQVDLILLDVVMPDIGGLEVCQRLRSDPVTSMVPIVMITASGDEEKVRAIESGADDFITRPFNRHELVARVRTLLRVKASHDTIEEQAAELMGWNRTLEERVKQQVEKLERLDRLRRFLSPQLAEVIMSSGNERVLDSHRREIAVVFADLRGFTAFAETAEPEEVMHVLSEFDAEVGAVIFDFEGTLIRFMGDGVMVIFNDPFPCPEPALRAARMALAMRERVGRLQREWSQRGHSLGLGIGISLGYATLGRIGFEGRFDYDAIGPVVNLASRLCDEAEDGQILLGPRANAALGDRVTVQEMGTITLKGFHRPLAVQHLVGVTETFNEPAQKASR